MSHSNLYTPKKQLTLSDDTTVSEFSAELQATPKSLFHSQTVNNCHENPNSRLCFSKMLHQTKSKFSYNFEETHSTNGSCWKSNRGTRVNPTNIYDQLTEATKSHLQEINYSSNLGGLPSEELLRRIDALKILKKDSDLEVTGQKIFSVVKDHSFKLFDANGRNDTSLMTDFQNIYLFKYNLKHENHSFFKISQNMPTEGPLYSSVSFCGSMNFAHNGILECPNYIAYGNYLGSN
jgi:hypothetical protein